MGYSNLINSLDYIRKSFCYRRYFSFYVITLVTLSISTAFLLYKLTSVVLAQESTVNDPGQYPLRPPAECDVDVELLIDISGSMARIAPDGRQNLDWAKEAANAFIAEMGYFNNLPDNDVRVGLSTFGMTYTGAYNSGVIRQPLTDEWYMVRNAVNGLTSTTVNGYGTCVECGLRAARADLFNNIVDTNRLKAVIMISDGYGNRTLASGNQRVSLQIARSAAITEAYTGKFNRMIYFVIGYGSGGTFDALTLNGVANDPDSSYYFYKPDATEWVDEFRNLALKVCDRPITNSCTVASTHSTTSTSPLVLTSGTTTQIGTNFSNFSPLGGSAEVRYRFSTPGIVTTTSGTNFTVPNPAGSTSLSYYFTRVNVSPVATAPAGSTTQLISDVFINGEWACSATTHLKTEPAAPPAWWQISGGDAVAVSGNIRSIVPESPNPKVLFASNYLGFPIFDGNIFPVNRNLIGTPGWTANTRYVATQTPAGTNYNYAYFVGKYRPGVTISQGSIVNSTYFDSNLGSVRDGYQVYVREGDLELGTLNFANGIAKKVILLVNGDVTLNGKISLDDGRDFFMLVSSGDIFVNSSVGDSAPVSADTSYSEDLEGVFVSNGQFVTSFGGATPNQLVVRGIVVGWGNSGIENGVDFGRNLGNSNTTYPSEIFKFAPDLLLNFPPFYSEKSMIWKEVSPE